MSSNAITRQDNSNVHRGVHTLGTRATEAYEVAREQGGAVHPRAIAGAGCLYARHHRVAEHDRVRLRAAAAEAWEMKSS